MKEYISRILHRERIDMKYLGILVIIIGCQGIVSGQSVKGRITSSDGVVVPGASVRLLNTVVGAASDQEGVFELKVAGPGTYQIQVSAIGFATLEQPIEIGQEVTSQDFQLAEAASQLEAVIVTAQKTEEEMQKVPISVSAISALSVQQYRLWNTKDITAIVPNLYSSNPGDNRNVTSIRGITSTSYDPSVTTYIDGVNQFSLDTYIAQLVDVERIEVLRGPQGTLYGRNSMGGVINIITKQPGSQPSGYGEINLGSNGQQRYSLGIRTPLIKNKLFLGVAGMFDQSDGFYTNEFDNSHFDKKHSFVGNYYLRYMAGTSWSFTLNVKHNENRNQGAYPLSFDALTNPFKVNQNSVGHMVDNVLNSSLAVNYAGKGFNFSSQTTYQTNTRYYETPIDGDFSPIDGVTIIDDYGKDWNYSSAWTQELKFTSPATASRLKWTAGFYGFSQANPVKQTTHFGADAAFVGGIPNSNSTGTSKASTTGYALFGQVTYGLSEKLDVIGGLRYDFEHKTLSGNEDFQIEPGPPFTVLSDTTATADFNAISPKLGLSLRINEQSNLYLNYAGGFRTGGFTPLSPDPSLPPMYAYKPEYSNNVEAGIKKIFFGNKLRVNVAAFYVKATDVQVPTLVLPQAITVTRNAGELESKGIEVELSATPITQLQVNYSFGYTDARYTNLKLSQGGTEVDLNGNRQLFTPDVTSMLAVQYHWNLTSTGTFQFIARLEWMFLGSQYYDLANTIRQSPYNLINARVGFTAKKWELYFWMRNLGDERYVSYAYDFGAAHLGDPKNYGMTLRKNF